MTTNTPDIPGAGTGPTQRTNELRRWHALHAAEAVAAVESDVTSGLSNEKARRRLARFGENALREPKRRSLLSLFAHQFKSPLIYLLFVAAGIALALGHTTDAFVIFVVLLLNALIGTFQEGRAERSLEVLRKLVTHKARVMRGGQELVVLSCRSERRSAFSMSLFKNRWLIGGLIVGNLLQGAVVFFRPLGDIFHTVPFSLREVVAIGAVASLVLWVEELRKLIARRRERRPTLEVVHN